MHIYIDEAGNFLVPTARPYSISLVLALVIPTAQEPNLFAGFKNIRSRWTNGKDVEVKGSSLDESQAALIMEMLSRYDVLVEFCAVDMVQHTDCIVTDFKNRQAAAITAHLTEEHQPGLVAQLNELARNTRETPNQLFIQAFITMLLIFEAVQIATLYFAQRRPGELGEIAWIVDRKDRALTDMEKMWSTLILPAGEGRFARNPLTSLAGADYSRFDAHYGIAPDNEKMMRHIEWMRQIYGEAPDGNRRTVDAKRLLTEQLSFRDSRDSLGLQIADILATTLRRALNQKLRLSGWREFGKLLVRKRKDQSRFIALGAQAESCLTGHLEEVWWQLDSCSKSMLLD